MVGRIPSEEIRLMVMPVVLTGIYIILAHLAIIVIVSGLFASSVMRPVRRLVATMRDGGPAGPRFESLADWAARRGELAEIAARFNDLVLDNYRARLRANELAVLEREAQLNALQQQINPHFMYNALEAIKWMAYRKGERDISDMASAMGKFLRGNMALGEHFTSLAEEIEHLKSYLHIQQIRYEGRFEVRWEIEEGLADASVPRLILQPVVENSINHGFDEIRYKGVIAIGGRRVEGGLLLEIVDNGRGMDAERLEKVRADLENRESGASDSIGLANVRSRLKLALGPQASLGIDSVEGGGTTVSMLLPRGTIGAP
jgi:two-component system sensor histidine kinase YesM